MAPATDVSQLFAEIYGRAPRRLPEQVDEALADLWVARRGHKRRLFAETLLARRVQGSER